MEKLEARIKSENGQISIEGNINLEPIIKPSMISTLINEIGFEAFLERMESFVLEDGKDYTLTVSIKNEGTEETVGIHFEPPLEKGDADFIIFATLVQAGYYEEGEEA